MRKGIIILLFLAGCSSPPEKIAPKSYTVEISSMEFHPSDLTVRKGDTVVFVNKDMVVHDVTEDATKAWTSGNLAVDSSYKLVVTGSARYYCQLHPVMKGTIAVSEGAK